MQDMTAFIARNATETIGFIATQADDALTNWTVGLSKKYISIPAKVYDLPG
jgi:leucyl aminopeptidase